CFFSVRGAFRASDLPNTQTRDGETGKKYIFIFKILKRWKEIHKTQHQEMNILYGIPHHRYIDQLNFKIGGNCGAISYILNIKNIKNLQCTGLGVYITDA
ncbi:hypothetical protein ACJX0J_017900, partial [Zea mays]